MGVDSWGAALRRWAPEYASWGKKGSAAVVDMGLSSAANFAATILLVRLLSLSQFGAYALAIAALQFGLQIQSGSVLEPMSVLGPASHARALRRYLAGQIRLNLVVMCSVGLLLCLGSLIWGVHAGNSDSVTVLTALGILLPLLSFPFLVRRVLYVLNRPTTSAVASLVYGATFIVAIWILSAARLLSGSTALGAMAIAGLPGWLFLASVWRGTDRNGSSSLRSMLRENWSYGKWSTASGMLVALAVQFQLLASGAILGLAASGVIRAAQNVIQPVVVAITAVSALALPSMAKDFGEGDEARLARKARSLALVLSLAALVYAGGVAGWRDRLVLLAYGDRYLPYADVLAAWTVIPVIMALNSGIGAGLRARKRPDLVLLVAGIWAVVSTATGIGLTAAWGLWGATVSAALGYLVAYLSTIVLHARLADADSRRGTRSLG